jgi:hypothetical protein
MGTFAWLFVHGLKPAIYLSLNSTIRQEVVKMIYVVKLKNKILIDYFFILKAKSGSCLCNRSRRQSAGGREWEQCEMGRKSKYEWIWRTYPSWLKINNENMY